MNVIVVKTTPDGKRYNQWDQEVIPCSTGCGNDTLMLGTKLCDSCWEAERRMQNENSGTR